MPRPPFARRRTSHHHDGLFRCPLQLARDVPDFLPAPVWILLEAAAEDVIDQRTRRERRDWCGFTAHDRGDRRDRGTTRKRLLPGEHFVQHAAEREDVRTSVAWLPVQLLGSHVLKRATHAP